MAAETHSYHPSRWIRVVVGVAMLIFVVILVIAIKTSLKPFYLVISVGMVAFAALAFVESFIARVDVEANGVVIKGLFTTKRVALSDVEKVSAEGGRTSLYMKTGKWKRLPDWMGSNMSARRYIADRLKAR